MMKNKYIILIRSCWILLLACCIFKLFGANIFIAGVDDGNFKTFCNFVNDNSVLKFIISIIINALSCIIYYMAILEENKPKLKWTIPLIIYVILKQIFNKFDILFFVLDFIMTIGFPLFLKIKNWKRILLGCVLTLIFQVLSMFLKMDNYTMFDNNFLVGIILSIDYYIMLVLYYLYSNYNDKAFEKGE